MLAWKISRPSREKLFSCGGSPDGIVPRSGGGGGDHIHDGRGRGGDEQAPPVGRESHVVGPVAVHLHPPADLARLEVDRHHVGEARSREEHDRPSRRGEAVVDVLVVPLADELADPSKKNRRWVSLDLRDPLRASGIDIQALEALERVRVDHVGGARPVVAHHQDVAQRPLLGGHGWSSTTAPIPITRPRTATRRPGYLPPAQAFASLSLHPSASEARETALGAANRRLAAPRDGRIRLESGARAGGRTSAYGRPVTCCRPISQVRLPQRQASSERPSSSRRGVAQGRQRQLGMQHAAVAGQAAAGRCRPARRPRRPARARPPRAWCASAQVPRGARRVDRDRRRPRAGPRARAAADRAPTRSSRALDARSARALVVEMQRTSWSSPCAHEFASITTGSRPPSVQRQSASAVLACHELVAALRSPSSSTASRSSGRRRRRGSRPACPARRETSTSASGSAGAPGAARVAEDAVDARGQVDRRGALARRSRAAARARAAACSPGHAGTSSLLTRAARPPEPRTAVRRRPRAPARSPARAHALDRRPARARRQRRPTPRAAVRSRARNSLISLPVSIATGQAGLHVPSAAQVSMRVVLVVRAAAPRSTGEPSGWRAISRRSTIRWRGVVVSVAARADRLAEPALHAGRRPPPRSAAWT